MFGSAGIYDFLNAQLIELMAAMSTYPVVMKLELEHNAISTRV